MVKIALSFQSVVSSCESEQGKTLSNVVPLCHFFVLLYIQSILATIATKWAWGLRLLLQTNEI
jgi:hypothetical protein